jgi:hypothetical protein
MNPTQRSGVVPVLAAFAVLAFPAAASAQVSLTDSSYPQHPDSVRVPLVTDLKAANVGINRADCAANGQWIWSLVTSSVGSFDHIDLYASANNTTCADLVARTTTKSCFKIASFSEVLVRNGVRFTIRLQHIIQAIRGTDVVDPATFDKTVCDATASMTPTQFYIHFVPMDGSGTPVGGTAATDFAFGTAYDLAGPDGPSDLSLGGGSHLITTSWTNNGNVPSDFVKWRAYVYTDGVVYGSTKGLDGALDETDADALVDETDTAAGDTATA